MFDPFEVGIEFFEGLASRLRRDIRVYRGAVETILRHDLPDDELF